MKYFAGGNATKTNLNLLFNPIIVLLLCCCTQFSFAAITMTGDAGPIGEEYYPNCSVYVGDTGTGSMTISEGSYLYNRYDSYIGCLPGSDGTVTVTGSGSTWECYEDISIGTGNLDIICGGEVINAYGKIDSGTDYRGTVTVSGVGSKWNCRLAIYIGARGYGTLNIANGATVESDYCQIGLYSFGKAKTTVSDSGSLLEIDGEIFVAGTLLINNKGMVQSNSGSVEANESEGMVTEGKVTIDGIGSAWLTGNMNVGDTYYNTDAKLEILNGGEFSSYSCAINGSSESIAEVTVDGSGSTLTTSNSIGVTGVLNITGGACVDNGKHITEGNAFISSRRGSIPEANVSGAGSCWSNSGKFSIRNGTLNVTEGGILTSDSGYISDYTDANGITNISGAGSAWNNNYYLYVGGKTDISAYNSIGELNILAGGQASCMFGYIGSCDGSKGVVLVDGQGSCFDCSSFVYIGDDGGSGDLNIKNGGVVTSGYCWVGDEETSEGTITVEGSGSKWILSSYLNLGSEGSGILSIAEGGLVKVFGKLKIDDNGDGDSYIKIDSGGMLALHGYGDSSLDDFLDLIDGTDDIRYWDDTIGQWVHISNAVLNEDFTLDYHNVGEMAGYTVLICEPSIISIGEKTLTLAATKTGSLQLEIFSLTDPLDWYITGQDSYSWITSVWPESGSSNGPDDKTTVTIQIDSGDMEIGKHTSNLELHTNTGDIRIMSITLNMINRVDMEELSLLAQHWQMDDCVDGSDCGTVDWFNDDVIDIHDLCQLAESWLSGEIITGSSEITDDFETGDFSKLDWQFSGSGDWVVVSDEFYEGSYSAKSGVISHDQQSDLEITVDTANKNTISFNGKVSSESGYDYLRFYIDGIEQDDWSGEVDWETQTYTFTPGEHTFQWSYTKDGSVSSGSDCGWIDDVRIYRKVVDSQELAVLAAYWLEGGCGSYDDCYAADWYVDGEINLYDFAVLADSWLSNGDITRIYP